MRVLIDTNVLISAALSANGTPYHFPYDIVNNNMHDVLKLYQSRDIRCHRMIMAAFRPE